MRCEFSRCHTPPSFFVPTLTARSDLLCRIRQDIQRVHQDLTHQITAVHQTLYRLGGVLVPDFEQALQQQAEREIHTIPIPPAVSQRFRQAALVDVPLPAPGEDVVFQLEEMADAFVLHFTNSTGQFVAGILVENMVPPSEQYLNLLKCVWLMQKIHDSEQLKRQPEESHWPSYIGQLEDVSKNRRLWRNFQLTA